MNSTDYLEEQRQKSEERHNKLIDKLIAVASALGDGWKMTIARDASGTMMAERAKLVHPDYDYYIFIRYGDEHIKSEKNKLKIRADGSFFINKATHKQCHAIYLSFDKKPEVIARDIERRVLPDLIKHDRDAKANYLEALAYDAAVNKNMASLVTASRNLLQRSQAPHQERMLNYYSRHAGIHVEAKASATYVTLKFEDLSPGQADELVKYVFDHFIVDKGNKVDK